MFIVKVYTFLVYSYIYSSNSNAFELINKKNYIIEERSNFSIHLWCGSIPIFIGDTYDTVDAGTCLKRKLTWTINNKNKNFVTILE